MSHTSVSHLTSKLLLEQLDNNLARESSMSMINFLRKQLQSATLTDHEMKFFKGLIKQGTMKFFLVPSLNPGEPSIGLVSKNFKSIMYIALNRTSKKYIKFYNSPFILDLLHLHSYQKGEGRKLMEVFKDLQKEINIPGSLWTELDQNVEYFKQFGFINLGNLGENGEFLMKLPIESK